MVVDTSVFIEFLRAKQKENTVLYKLPDVQLYFSSVTFFELFMGATTNEKQKDIFLVTEGLLDIPLNNEIASRAGQIYQELRKKNQLIEFRDIFIAATCLVHDLPLLTHNKKHFERIAGLKLI